MSDTAHLRSLTRMEQGIALLCKSVIGITLCTMFSVMLCSIVLRYLAVGMRFTTLISELPELLFPWLISAGMVLAAQHGSHLSILFLTARLRGRALSAAILLRLLCILAVYGLLAFETALVLPIISEEYSAILGVSAGLTYACLMAGFLLLILSELIISIRYFCYAILPVNSLSAEAT